MTEKSERVVTYVTPSTKAAIDQEATNRDVSRAELVRNSLHRELKAEQQERITKTTNAEQRIESLIAEARDATKEVSEEIDRATQQYHDLLAINAVYSVGSFRLLGDFGSFSDQQRQAAIESGVNRLQATDVPELDLSALGVDQQQQQRQSNTRASESRAQQQEGQQPQQHQEQQQQQQSNDTLPGQTSKPSKPSPSGGDDDDADGDMDVDDLL
jgi:hypothetical protein